jgi:predicted ATPase
MAVYRIACVLTYEVRSSSLPLGLTRFIGREAAMAELVQRCASGQRLVVIIGPPGAGKTRLAIEFARAHAARLEVKPIFCDLARASTAAEARWEIRAALLASDEASDGQRLEEMLAQGRFLLLLDNMEQMANEASNLLVDLLAYAPQLRVVATSRIRLDIQGEQILDLSSLSLPEPGAEEQSEAIQLFVDRVRAVRPDYQLGGDVATVAEVVAQLDGLPLAIELAAVRMRSAGANQLLALLRDRFATLRRRANESGRWPTLEAAIEWSWEFLRPWEQAALLQLSVFRGHFSLAAARSVIDISDYDAALSAEQIIADLCDHSLVRTHEHRAFPGELRYSLYRSVRHFARKRIDRRMLDAAMDRHAKHYTALCVQLFARSENGDPLPPYHQLVAEEPNVFAAVRRRPPDHLPNNARAAELFRRAGDRAREGMTICHQGMVDLEHGRFSAALQAFERGFQLIEESGGEPAPWPLFALCRGICEQQQALYEPAERSYTRALEGARAVKTQRYQALALAALGTLAAAQDRVDAAESLLAEALRHVDRELDAAVARAIDIHRGHLLLARARRARLSGDEAQAAELEAQVRNLIDSAANTELALDRQREVRWASVQLQYSYAARTASDEGCPTLLVVDDELRWIELPPGRRVYLGNRRAIRAILASLVELHQQTPGHALPPRDVLAVGWPGEELPQRLAKRRIHTAIWSLRREVGLDQLIVCRHDGYLLHPHTRVQRKSA